MAESKMNADKALEISDEVSILTSGISMRPMLREHKDIVIIERVKRKLKKNDVPLYRRANCDKLVLHRIIKVTDNGYVIRGDNLFVNEYEVTDEDIVGVLKAFYRNGKYYDCATSKAYHTYIILNRMGYPFRYLWRMKLKPFLYRIKCLIFKKR